MELRANLDLKNAKRMARLSSMAQDTVVLLYQPSRRGPITNPQAHIGSFIRGVREALQHGIKYQEILRLQGLARPPNGLKVSYAICDYFAQGRCYKGESCLHVHTLNPRRHAGPHYDDDEEDELGFGWSA